MPDLDELRQTYRDLLDGRLLQIAVHEAGDLTQEAVQVLHEELSHRGLAESLGVAVAAQTRQWTPQEIEVLLSRIQRLPCPVCGTTGQVLNAFKVVTVTSFIIGSKRKEQLILGCPACVERAAKSATNVSLAAGWWSFPHGPIDTVSACIANAKARKARETTEPTKEFIDYVRHNQGKVALLLKSSSVPAPR